MNARLHSKAKMNSWTIRLWKVRQTTWKPDRTCCIGAIRIPRAYQLKPESLIYQEKANVEIKSAYFKTNWTFLPLGLFQFSVCPTLFCTRQSGFFATSPSSGFQVRGSTFTLFSLLVLIWTSLVWDVGGKVIFCGFNVCGVCRSYPIIVLLFAFSLSTAGLQIKLMEFNEISIIWYMLCVSKFADSNVFVTWTWTKY